MKKKTCYDCHGFKWQNINIYSILILFLLQFNAFFGSLDYDCTLKAMPRKMNVKLFLLPRELLSFINSTITIQ